MPGRNQNQKPLDMAYAILAHDNPRTPRSFAAAHPGYGANALAAADEKLAAELSTRRSAISRQQGPLPTATAKPDHSTVAIDAQLATARKTTAAAKAAYEAALATEEGLKQQRAVAVARGEGMKGLAGVRAAKLRRREMALGLGCSGPVAAAGRPAGIGKAVADKKASVQKAEGIVRKLEGLSKREGLSEGFLEKCG